MKISHLLLIACILNGFFSSEPLRAEEAFHIPDELNPTKVLPKLAWKKIGSSGMQTFCELNIADKDGNELSSTRISAPTFSVKFANNLKLGDPRLKDIDSVRTYSQRVNELGFGSFRVDVPKSSYSIQSNASGGACGSTDGYVRIRDGKVQVVCIDMQTEPCSGTGDGPDGPTTYSVVISKELPLSEVMARVPSQPKPTIPSPQPSADSASSTNQQRHLNSVKILKESSSPDLTSVQFAAPYPIIWEDSDNTPNFGGNGRFSLIGIAVGNIVIDKDTLTALWNGFNSQGYALEQKVFSLILHLKINVLQGAQLPRLMRLVKTQAGERNKYAPPHRDFLYPNHKPMNDFVQAGTTIDDAIVFFPVDRTQNEFIVNTGGVSNIDLKVLLKDKRLTLSVVQPKN